MDNLTQTLANRALPDQNSSVSNPAVIPHHAKTPSAEKRFSTAQAMQDSYRNGWNPNPVLLRILANRQWSN